MHRVPPAAIHDGNGTWTACGAFPVFPARPPRRRARVAPFSAARPGAAGRPAGAPPVPMGSGASRRGPSSWRPPRFHRMRKDRAPDHRIRIPPVRRSGRGPADTNEYGEGREEGGEGTDGRPNGYERGNTSERRRMGREGRPCPVPWRPWGEKNEEPPGSPKGLDRGEPYRVERRRATLPHPLGCSTIAVQGLSFRVRNGTGRLTLAMAAANLVDLPRKDPGGIGP